MYDIAGRPIEGAKVQAALPDGARRSGGAVIVPNPVATESDSTGDFYLDLIPSQYLLPDSTQYEITITYPDGAIIREKTSVPDVPSWLFVW